MNNNVWRPSFTCLEFVSCKFTHNISFAKRFELTAQPQINNAINISIR